MATPIEHVVVIVKENHTFDNYFGAFPGVRGAALPHAPERIADPRHDHAAWLKRSTSMVRQGYGAADIPEYWALARQYTLCDNYFSDVASQSEPNHLYLLAADAPVIDNSSKSRTYQPTPPYDMPSLPQALEDAGREWRSYAGKNEAFTQNIASLKGHRWNVAGSAFDRDVARGFLPDVSWLFAPGKSSEHPGTRVGNGTPSEGAKWTMDRIEAVAKSRLWASTAIVVTWDDFGGWFDHVAPRIVATWEGGGPRGYAGSQYRYGPRVPCLVVSPFAKAGFVNHDMFSHASVVKLCLRLFGIPAWNAPALRPVDLSGDLFSCFDFAAAPRLGVPDRNPV